MAESDFAAQARIHAAQLGQNLQVGAKDAADRFNRFVEGDTGPTGAGSAQRSRYQPDRQDFWDDFSAVGEQQAARQKRQSSSGAIGTAAMRNTPTLTTTAAAAAGRANATTGPAATGVGANTASGNNATLSTKEKEDWGEDW